MTTQNIADLASAVLIPLNTNGQINIDFSGFYGWGFDMDVYSSAAVGTINIYTQFTNPVGDFADSSPIATFNVTGGNYGLGIMRQTIDSNYLITKSWLVIKWTGSDTSNGTLTIVGIANVF